MLKKLKNTSFSNYLLVIILGLASFLRLYRINELLGFWYDQGRDALIIWDLIHKGKFFLIGPTTGLAGVFRGPWYYYLIAPFYFLGGGNPVWPSVFLIATTILSIYIIYGVAKKSFGVYTALLFTFISAFSYYFISSSRWLSNPTPMFLVSALYILGLSKVIEGKSWGWYLIALMSGMAMQFGSASEVFYIPAAIVFGVMCRKYAPSLKTLFISLVIFAVPFGPQLIFDVRHGWIILTAVYNNFFGGVATPPVIWKDFLPERLSLYYDIFASKIFFAKTVWVLPFLFLAVIKLVRSWKRVIVNPIFVAILVMVFTPFIGLILFRGNYGILYDYYFTGYYLPIILLFSFLLANITPVTIRNVTVGIFAFLFIYLNFPIIKGYLTVKVDSGTMVFLGNQEKAIDWVYKDAKGRDFNVDEYVPPVIPYAYQYLFKWLGSTKYSYLPLSENIPLLYVLTEADPDHPDRIQAWYARQNGIANVQESASFGTIAVERRIRIEKK